MMIELEEFIEQSLVQDSFKPEKLVEIISEVVDISEEKLLNHIEKEYPLTKFPGRRSFKYCLQCNPHLNGKMGKKGTEAVAKHKIEDRGGVEQSIVGWEGLCYNCAYSMKTNPYINLIPLSGYEHLDIFSGEKTVEHECDDPKWNKTSLVTESGGFDWVECKECGIRAKRYGMDLIEIVGYDK